VRSRRGLGEATYNGATYNGAGLQSWESGLSATQSISSDPLKTAKNQLVVTLCRKAGVVPSRSTYS